MAKLPPLRRLVAEDFQDQSDWIGKLIQPLNEHMERVTRAFNKGLTIEENFSGELREVTVDGVYPLKLAWTQRQRPRSVVVGGVRKADGSTWTLSTAVQVQWQYTQGGELQIDTVVGISPTSADKYILTLEVKTG